MPPVRFTGRTEPASVQAVSMDGTVGGFFGSAFNHEDPAVRSHMSRGGIACTHEPERVATFFHGGPLIHAYDFSGRSVWVANVSGFRPTETHGTPLSDGRIMLSRPGRSPEDRIQRRPRFLAEGAQRESARDSRWDRPLTQRRATPHQNLQMTSPRPDRQDASLRTGSSWSRLQAHSTQLNSPRGSSKEERVG